MSKIANSIRKVWSYVPKRAAAVTVLTAGIIAAVTIPAAIQAWGPVRTKFTMEKPASYVTFNSITDNPDVGSELNFLRVRDSDKANWYEGTTNGWTDTIFNMQEGHTYDVRMYVHNNAAANLNLVAQNTRAFINLPVKEDTFGKQFEINGFLSADNANPGKIWDNIVLKSDKAFHVKIVSAKYYNNLKTEKSEGYNLGDSIADVANYKQNKGVLLGYDKMDGLIPGCLAYSGYVLVKVQPVFQVVPAPSYDVEKTVDKTTANPGDTINYTINVKNTGNINLTNVKVTDQLPAYYSNAKEVVNSKNGSTGSIVNGGNITFKQLNVGETATIKVSYTIKGKDALECGTTTIKNKATGTTDQDQTEDKTDNNEVTTTVDKDCTPPPVVKHPGYDVIKTVDKTAAKPGDTIKYTITAKNTGEVDLTNVKISDKLPAYYANAKETVKAEGQYSGSIVKNGEVTIAKLAVGKSATITIEYQIKGKDALECGTTTIKNKATGTTDQDQTEDKTDNNEVTTTVDKDCTPVVPPVEKKPGFDLVKTVDKTTATADDTLTYTLTFRNTGETDLTNVVITDKLPENLTMVDQSMNIVPEDTKYEGDLAKGLTLAKVEQGKEVTITFQAKVADVNKLQCGENQIVNNGVATTDQQKNETDTTNNQVTTDVNRECVPETPETPVTPVTPTTPEAPKQEQSQTPQSPTVIAQTGAGEAVISLIGAGALATATVAYIRSRKYAK